MIALLLAAELISIQAYPRVCHEPCDIRITLKVEPAKDNHSVVLQIEAPDSPFYRRTDIHYDERSPKTVEIWYKATPGGTYTITANLVKHDAKTWIAGTSSAKVQVGGFNDNKNKGDK